MAQTFSSHVCVNGGSTQPHSRLAIVASELVYTISWTCFINIMGLGGEAEHVQLGTFQKPGLGRGV